MRTERTRKIERIIQNFGISDIQQLIILFYNVFIVLEREK